MSWHRILLPVTTNIDPNTVEVGKRAWECYEKENKPTGFAMFHATESGEDGQDEKFVIYLSPVAASLCSEVVAEYTPEPCEVPHYNEPNIAFVFGDPRVMGELRQQ
jgi:hypothetical protein